VGILGDQIAAVGDLQGATAAQRLAARGLVVTPGFIDIHTHSDFTPPVDGRADSQICQGVTTEAIGQCGFSAAPMGEPADASNLIGHLESGMALEQLCRCITRGADPMITTMHRATAAVPFGSGA
jgi:N-acyl-D-aspartate/D-glutamate deacylase